MSKLSFGAAGLDKQLPIYLAGENPDLDFYVDNLVAQKSTGMDKEEEKEAHNSGTVIRTPKVHNIEDLEYLSELYPQNIKKPKKLIYIQLLAVEGDIPDYDMDEEDEIWIMGQDSRFELTPNKFEKMIDQLEKGSGRKTVVTLEQAKALLKEDHDLIMAVYDYWLNKRLTTKCPLIPQVRTEEARPGVKTNNPYIAFRKRPENKVQTRRNRMKGERSYVIMLKLQREMTRARSILEMVKCRELRKRELVQLSIEIFEKMKQAGDSSEEIISEAVQQRPASPVVIPIVEEAPLLSLSSVEEGPDKNTSNKSASECSPAASGSGSLSLVPGLLGTGIDVDAAMSEDDIEEEEEEDEGPYAFRRKAGVLYQAPVENPSWPWCAEDESGIGNKRLRYYPTSLPSENGYEFVGFTRPRYGRGGRSLVLDRIRVPGGLEKWRKLVSENSMESIDNGENSHSVADPLSPTLGCVHYRPKTPEIVSVSDSKSVSESEQQASMDLDSSSEEDQDDNRPCFGKRGCGIQEDSEMQQ